MIEYIEEEDHYVTALCLMDLLSKFQVDSSRFHYASILQECSQFERCPDCDDYLNTECICAEQAEERIHNRYKEYDDGDDQY